MNAPPATPPSAPPATPPPAAAGAVESFGFGEWHGRIAGRYRPDDLRWAVERVIDPAQAVRTLHWGRNYLFLANFASPDGPLPVAVKQFRNERRREQAKRRLVGSKAAKSWRVARGLLEAGLLTPEPVLLVESDRADGPSYFVCRHLPDALEARYLLRAVNAGTAAERFPDADVEAFLVALARTARRLHDAGFWHRDLSSGNVLIRWRGAGLAHPRPPELYLLDLNRTRTGRVPTVSERSRDLSRMMIHRREDQALFLDAYWSAPAGRWPGEGERNAEAEPARPASHVRRGAAGPLRRGLYRLYHHGFRFKNDAKKAVRAKLHGIVQTAKDLVLPRGAHAHIPRAPEGAATRDKVVWDVLSDQPHLHAGKLEKHWARLRDAGSYAAQGRVAATAAPRAWRRYRQLVDGRFAEPVPFAGAGVALRPWPADPDGLLAAVEELGARHALLRLHPWEDDHDAEEALARALAGRGVELAFALPQNRDLVRDPERWRRSLEELADRFLPYGRDFVVGQAVNRSKWGVWHAGEYRRLAEVAADVLRRAGGGREARSGDRQVRLLGPGVIDFEPLATLGLVNFPRLPQLDGLASLLYVDRRGAPEERQMGFDAADKAALLRAVADTARHCAGRSWVTEVNWPLREGPHSPAGRLVAVGEETQADYLVRYYVAVLADGLTERVYWWQMVARGYGLLCPEEGPHGSGDSSDEEGGEEDRRESRWENGGDAGGSGARSPEAAALRLRRRPSFRAFRNLLAQLDGSHCEGLLPEAPGTVRAYRFRHPDGSLTLVAWATGDDRPRIALPGELLRAVDRDGREVAVRQPVALGPSPLYLRLAE